MPKVNDYYDWTGNLSDDGEGGLVRLCGAHARQLGEDAVQFAQRGHDQAECSIAGCEASNDPEHSAELDQAFAEPVRTEAAEDRYNRGGW